MTNEKSKNGSRLGAIAALIGALAAITISIIATRSFFPPIIFCTIVILLVVTIISIIAYGFLAYPISNFIKGKRKIRKHNALARKYFDKFKDFTDRFGEFVETSRTDGIPHALSELRNRFQEFRNMSFLSTHNIHNLFYHFKERLKRFNGTKDDFLLLAEEFDTIFDMYNELCICKPVEEVRRIGQEKVDSSIKEDYRKYKGIYDRFLLDYTEFGKKLNKKFGEHIFRACFETPKEL